LLWPAVRSRQVVGSSATWRPARVALTVSSRASSNPARLSIVVENPCDPDRPRGTGAGVGVSNVRKRLGALYGAEAIVNSSEQGGVWRMELSFPVERRASDVGKATEPA